MISKTLNWITWPTLGAVLASLPIAAIVICGNETSNQLDIKDELRLINKIKQNEKELNRLNELINQLKNTFQIIFEKFEKNLEDSQNNFNSLVEEFRKIKSIELEDKIININELDESIFIENTPSNVQKILSEIKNFNDLLKSESSKLSKEVKKLQAELDLIKEEKLILNNQLNLSNILNSIVLNLLQNLNKNVLASSINESKLIEIIDHSIPAEVTFLIENIESDDVSGVLNFKIVLASKITQPKISIRKEIKIKHFKLID